MAEELTLFFTEEPFSASLTDDYLNILKMELSNVPFPTMFSIYSQNSIVRNCD